MSLDQSVNGVAYQQTHTHKTPPKTEGKISHTYFEASDISPTLRIRTIPHTYI